MRFRMRGELVLCFTLGNRDLFLAADDYAVCGLYALYPSSSETAKYALKELGDSKQRVSTQQMCGGK